MKSFATLALIALSLGGAAAPALSQSAPAQCDRACLGAIGKQFVASIAAKDPSKVLRTQTYAATENGVASALEMMTLWRTATGTPSSHFIIDTPAQQVFVIAAVSEGPSDAVLFGRLKVVGRLVSEIEFYTNRSRGDGGFAFDAKGLAQLPRQWTEEIAPARLPTRAKLQELGRSIFDMKIPGPPDSTSCDIVENGQVVGEDPEILSALMPPGALKGRDMKPRADGTVTVPCGTPPERPTDPKARVIVDEQSGIALGLATIDGATQPYLVTKPTLSAFVPFAILEPYAKKLREQQASGKYTASAIRSMPATATVAHVIRVYDGKLQAMHLLVHLGPPGSHSAWTGK